MSRWFVFAWVVWAGSQFVAPSALAAAAKPPATKPIEFNRDIRQILSDNCFACHGPDDNKRKAKLRFDLKEDAFKPAKSGELAIVPGHPEKSELIHRLTAKDEDDRMPPAKSGKKPLSAAQVDLLTRWIKEGAAWQEHWAFQKPQRPAVPVVKEKKWPKNPIDNFVAARLEKEKLKPSPEADKTTLIRRASLDTTGLPPTPAEVDAFLADKSATAYDKVVDRLLASPSFGEHEARYWLDGARYADSHGFHIDSERSIWKYREYVINAFNTNKPYNEFTIEQLAGDLLPEATPEQKIASGFVRCNMSTGEGGAIAEEYQAKYTFDRTETMSTMWLGLTMTCARCHTHKYDPILHKEYYGLFAFFNNLNESVMDGNKPNPDPFMKLPTRDQSARQEELKKWLAEGQKKMDAPVPELDAKQVAWETKWRGKLSEGWTALKPESVTSTNGTTFKVMDDASVLAEGENPPKDIHEVKIALGAGTLAGLRLETLPLDTLPAKSAARADDGAFRLGEFEAEIVYPDTNVPPASRREEAKEKTAATDSSKAPARQDAGGTLKPQKIKFTQAIADSAKDTSDAAKAIDGKPDTGWQADAVMEPHAALFLPADPVAVKSNATLKVTLRYEASTSKRAIGHFRLSAATNPELVDLLAPPKPEPWQVVGPFKTESTQQGFTNVFEPETKVDLKKAYAGVREEIKWAAKPDFADGKENLLVQDLHGLHGAYYLYRTIKIPSARKIDVSVRADDLFKLWVNGKPVAERATKAEAATKVSVNLKGGDNKVLLKVVTTQGAAYFTFNTDLEDADSVPADTAALFAATKKFTPDQQKKVRVVYRKLNSPEFKQTFDQVEKWNEENNTIEKSIPTTLVAKEMEKPRETFMLIRGEYDKKGDKVSPALPSILPPLPAGAPTNRLGLAKWLVDTNHPLTARVTVNRYWQQLFGVGIVKTAEDFGVQGDQPSHRELLDWLACEFMQPTVPPASRREEASEKSVAADSFKVPARQVSGGTMWDTKHMMRLMLTSATYRQSSKFTPELLAKDPENRLLARGPRFRVDAEVVRDIALDVSGLLVDQRGGKSVKPYEPPGLWEAVSFNNSQKYVPDKGDATYRRAMYTYWKRQSPPPNMMIFDAPTREYCVVRRPRTNTPLQALALMNDPQFVEAARAFGQRMILEGGKDAESRVTYGFRIATSRKPTKDETKVLSEIIEQELAAYRADKEAATKLLGVGNFKMKDGVDASELAAWTTVASMMLNLDETITKN